MYTEISLRIGLVEEKKVVLLVEAANPSKTEKQKMSAPPAAATIPSQRYRTSSRNARLRRNR